MTQHTIARETLNTFRNRLNEVGAQLEAQLLPENGPNHRWVIQTSPGLYIERRVTGPREDRVVQYIPAGVEDGSVWRWKDDAVDLASRITNGRGDRGVVMLRVDALKDEIETLGGLIADLESIVAKAA